MRYLVTGGLGFVGSWIARHLAQAGHEVFILSRNAAPVHMGFPYTLVTADLTADQAAIVASLPEGLHGCVHAASFNEGNAPDYGRRALAANTLGTRNLLEALAEKAGLASILLPTVVYLSTFHVYGKDHGHIDEHTTPEPKTEYALTHLLAEEYCRYYTRSKNFPIVTARLSNGYGAPITPDFNKWYLLLPDLCRMAFTQKRIALRSAPDTKRDFVWLGDVATCMECLLHKPEHAKGLLNIASGYSPSIGDIAALVAAGYCRRYGHTIDIHFGQVPSGVHAELTIGVERLHCVMEKKPFHNKLADEIDAIFSYLDNSRA